MLSLRKANKFCNLCSLMPQNRSLLVADLFFMYYEILRLIHAGNAGQARALNARRPAVTDQDGCARTASQENRKDCVPRQPKSCSKSGVSQTGRQGLRPRSTQKLHQPSNEVRVEPLLAGDCSHHVAANVPRAERFVLLPVPQLADLVAIRSCFASTPGYLKAIWPDFVVAARSGLRILVCGGDLWRSRCCKTSPVDLQGFWIQVWPKIGRKLARKFPAGFAVRYPTHLLFE